MAHIEVLQSGTFTSLAVATAPLARTGEQDVHEAFESVEPVVITGITEFPEFESSSGEVMDIPEYGAADSSQIGVQAERPLLEFSVLYSEASTSVFTSRAGNGQSYAFQIAITSLLPSSYMQVAGLGIGANGDNTVFNFAGQVVGFDVDPTLDSAILASVSIAIVSDLYGPFTYGGDVAGAITDNFGNALTDSDGNPIWN